MEAVAELYAECVEVSNAAAAFDDLREFDELTSFVSKIQRAQELLLEHILSGVRQRVIEAAAGGAKSGEILKFKGGDLFEDVSILFMLMGGGDQARREQLEEYGFVPLIAKLHQTFQPFALHHFWCKATNENSLTLHWH